ncbi:Site-specific recombinase XerD [Chryseobacterium taichungense]|jgi:site-specific recombinase XerD|uniref:Site-specific recombinase XerD n=1 Tax=Chryseobacterium taichungense TaxID=295069 RepID=A0A1H8A4V0_9FLAO|nr:MULTISPECIES: site-specific integrase [Chryseobacterium]MDQ1858313.1 site-specific integrase [Chryseobacterium sp. WLY505]SEM65583.1 Site-specific recombinase XerD [Chryseobacterium taichungense]
MTIKILFVLDKSKSNSKGLAPLKCRITYMGERKPFATGIFINPQNWDNKQQKAKPPNSENETINTQLSLIKNKINQAFLFLQVNEEEFDVEDVFLQYKGNPPKKNKTILQLFQEHNDRIEKLIGKEYSIATLWKFKQAKELLKDFIKYSFNKGDYHFKDLDLKFIQDYEFFLKAEKSLALATTNKMIQRFRKIVKLAISQDIIQKEPFTSYKVKHIKKEITYLTREELAKIEEYQFKAERLQIVADLFVFCCYTGLAYNEMVNLEKSHIIIGFDGNEWINMIRGKTQHLLSIPLLSRGKKIIEKYDYVDEKKALPKFSNQKFNAYLKEIADIVGLNKRLTHHLARRTFATTVLLFNDVPMEIVSELLGHSKITITQEHYAKVVKSKVGEQMNRLNSKLK